MRTAMSRREFLKAAGLTLAVTMTPSGYRILSAAEAGMDEPGAFQPSVWLQVTPDNIVTVVVSKSEMGQGVYTSLPMIVADELEADWKQVRVQAAPAGDGYRDPVWGTQATGGSTSIRHMHEPLRKAGAAAREMLITAAANEWGVPAGECQADLGKVRHPKTKRAMTYGELCLKAAKVPVPENPELKKENQFRYIGSPMPRVDLKEKISGSARFGMDTFVPGMLYAAIARPPAYGAKAISSDQEAAKKVSGVRNIVQLESGIAVCADTLDAAWKGRDSLKVKWGDGQDPGMNTESLERLFLGRLDQEGIKARDDGDATAALNQSARKVDATYLLPFLAHVTMEPMNCTASIADGKCEIWVPTQNQSGVLKTAVKITGLKPEQIQVHTTYLGGGFGRRFELDVVEEAVHLAKAAGKPVKVIWTREEDTQHDFYRPGNCCRIQGGIDDKGNMTAWSHKVVCPSIFARVFPDEVKEGIDPAAVEGISNMEYEIPNLHVEYIRIDTPVPVGFWRSVGSSHNAFTVESFVDELAHAAGVDPLTFRLNHLKKHPRPRRVLEVAAEKAGWGKALTQGDGRGIAMHFSFGSYVAQVAEVSLDRKDGTIKVHRVVCAVDCGHVINPDIVKAQMTGGILMGLSAALKEGMSFSGGGVESSNFHNYDILRMDEAPEAEVHIVESGEDLGGIGEPGVPPIAPAVANALFAVSGIRLRRLPMTPAAVLGAMKKV